MVRARVATAVGQRIAQVDGKAHPDDGVPRRALVDLGECILQEGCGLIGPAADCVGAGQRGDDERVGDR
jgi:hypothetical protein